MHGIKSDKMKYFDIACDVLKVTPDELRKGIFMPHPDADKMLADLWYKLNPQDENQVIAYYTQHPEYTIFQLRMCYNVDIDYCDPTLFNRLINYIPWIREMNILDYGTGHGMTALSLINSGCKKMTLADVPTPLFEIVKRIIFPFIKEDKFSGTKFLDINEKYPLKDNLKYDLIISTDCLEHIKEPDMVLRHLVGHLNQNSYIYLTTFFGGAHAPCHLVENNKFIPIWKDVLKVCGLVPISMNDIGGSNGLWQKIV